MVTRNFISIYKVDHHKLREPELVVADSVQDAIKKFNEFYENDIVIHPDGIRGVILHQTFEVLSNEQI